MFYLKKVMIIKINWANISDVKRLPLTFEFSRQNGSTSAVSESKQIFQSLSDSLRVRSSANEFTLLLCILSVLIKYTQQLYLKQDSSLHHSVTSTHHSRFRQDIIDIVNLFFMCSRWVKTFTTLIKIEHGAASRHLRAHNKPESGGGHLTFSVEVVSGGGHFRWRTYPAEDVFGGGHFRRRRFAAEVLENTPYSHRRQQHNGESKSLFILKWKNCWPIPPRNIKVF